MPDTKPSHAVPTTRDAVWLALVLYKDQFFYFVGESRLDAQNFVHQTLADRWDGLSEHDIMFSGDFDSDVAAFNVRSAEKFVHHIDKRRPATCEPPTGGTSDLLAWLKENP